MASKEEALITEFPKSHISNFAANDRKAKCCDLTCGIGATNRSTEA